MTKDEAKYQNNDTHIRDQHRKSWFMKGYQSACMEVGTSPTEFARRNPFHSLSEDDRIDWAKGKYERLGRQYDDLGWVDFYQGFLTGMYDCVGTVCEADQVERALLQKAWQARQNRAAQREQDDLDIVRARR